MFFGFTDSHDKLRLYSSSIGQARNKALRWVLFDKLMASLSCLDADTLQEAVVESPAATGHEGWDNLLAGSVEHLCAKHDLDIPDWVMNVAPADRSWFFPDEVNERRYQVPDPVTECAQRGVYVSSEHFSG